MKMLYQGKAKSIYTTDTPNELLMKFNDDATAFNGEKHEQFEDKGRINKMLTCLIYPILEKRGVPTHFIEDVNETNVLVKAVDIVPIELVVRNVVAGSLAKRTGLEEGHELSKPLIEYYYKDDSLGDPIINEMHIAELKLATPEELREMNRQALIVNEVLLEILGEAKIRLIDFKLEFGRLQADPSVIVLADEISPDTCRFWDAETNEKMDKDRFRRDMGGMMDAYREVLNRVQKIAER